MLKNNEFLESTEFSGNLYGTSKKAVEAVMQTGKICVLDVDKQGVKNIKKTDLNPTFIYVSPPSFEILEKRLRNRQTENESAIQKRLQEAKESMEFSKEPGIYHHTVINDNLEVAYNHLKGLLIKEIDEVVKKQTSAR